MSRGLQTQLQCLDNETSQALARYLQDENVDFQLAIPSINHLNVAERAICTLKNHVIAILCDTYPNFNLVLWDKLIPQALITLNILCKSNINTNISTYSQLYGAYDFNYTPITPLGIRVMVHKKPDDSEIWAHHSVEG